MTTQTPKGTSAIRMVLVMGAVGLAASVLLVGTFRLTAPSIAANRAAYLQASLGSVLEADTFHAFVPGGDAWRAATGQDEGARVFVGYRADSLVGLAVEASGQGYQDLIHILYAYDPTCGCVVGMTVLASKETPGLGDKIEKDPAFQANFRALQVSSNGSVLPVTLVKRDARPEVGEIDAISGATVSSQAIADIIRVSTEALVPTLARLDLPSPSADSTEALDG